MSRRYRIIVYFFVSLNVLIEGAASTKPCVKQDFMATSACNSGFLPYPTISKCIKRSGQPKSFAMAREECREHDSGLVMIASKIVDDALSRGTVGGNGGAHKAKHIDNDLWIDLSDSKLEGEFRWKTNGPVASWTKWGQGEPRSTDETWGCVLRSANSTWRVATCTDRHHFLCETFVGQKPGPPAMNIIFDKPPATMNNGSMLVANCSGFVADRGELRFEFSKPVIGNGASGFVILPDDPRVKYLEDRAYVVDAKTGLCRRRSRATLQMAVTGHMDGGTISCCAFLQAGFNQCRPSSVISVFFPPLRPNLKINFDKEPATVFKGRKLAANCTAFVGSQGYLSWVIQKVNKATQIWRIKIDKQGVRTDAMPQLFENGGDQTGFDDTNGPWISSVIHIEVYQSMHGSTISCCSYNVSHGTDLDGGDDDDDYLQARSHPIHVADSGLTDQALTAADNGKEDSTPRHLHLLLLVAFFALVSVF